MFHPTSGFSLICMDPLQRLQQAQLLLQRPRASTNSQSKQHHAHIFSTRLPARTNDNDDTSFLDSNDPFVVLQISSPTADAKEIRKAYRRMAVRYHPDVATNKDSTADEKKIANDRFARVNWAYQTLTGKNSDGAPSSGSGGSSSQTKSTGTGWTPPHRRTGTYASSSGGSTDWRDYIPNYRKEEEESMYDADGDSFGAIFADLFQAASAGASGGGGILQDFVEFLEQEVGSTGAAGGFGRTTGGSSYNNPVDQELRTLLETGTLEQIAEEMDDAGLVQQQLETKLTNLQQDERSVLADLNLATKAVEKMNFQEELAAVQARIPVVQQYLKQARKRLVKLQTRYKELIVQGQNDPKAGGGRSESVWDDIKREAASSGSSDNSRTTRSPSSSSTGRRQTQSTTRASSSSTGSNSSSDSDEDAWKGDSFGSFGRGRGSRGRASRGGRSRASTSETTDRTTTTSSTGSQQQSTYSSSSSRTTNPGSSYSSSSSSTNSASSTNRPTTTSPPPSSTQVPPHRRSSFKSYDDDKRRLRELKVDDEFDKLKKELGL